MPPSVAQTARIFEDPEPLTTSPKKKGWSNPMKSQTTPSPLGERHINSPPPPKKVPLKDEPQSRPPMHKKTGSATSFKGFLLGRERSNDENSKPGEENAKEKKSKKTKSSTNLASLLKKRSKKDLKADNKSDEVKTPPSPSKVTSPIWAQFATQPLEGQDGTKQYPIAHMKTLQHDTPPLTPQTYSDQHSAGQGQIQSYFDIDPELRMPQRPYLEKRGSRSSIFTEELHTEPASPRADSLDLCQPRPNCSRQHSTESSASTKNIGSPKAESPVKSKSRIFDALAAFNMKPRKERDVTDELPNSDSVDTQEVDSAFENVLGRYDIPQNLRDHMRNLKPEVKAGLVKGERIGSGSSNGESQQSSRSREVERPSSKDKENDGRRSRSRSRPRSRVFSMSRKSKDAASTKGEESTRSRSKSRPKSADMSARPLSAISNMSTTSLASMAANDGTSTPGDFIHYLCEVQKPELVEVGKIHKLRILLRNESVQWTDTFVKKGGMDEIAQLLHRIMKIEWREEHEDNLLHETLLCMKALTTTNLAMQRLESMEKDLLPALLKMLFDPERKGPAEFSTRALVISLVFAYLRSTLHQDLSIHEKRCRAVLDLMKDETPETDKKPLDFVSQMHTSRPYRTWCKEVTNVTREVFWIFLHHMNVVPVCHPETDEAVFGRKYFPSARAPHPAAPYVGGVEWEATQYLATQLDLLNGVIVSLPTRQERNQLREELKQSGFEKIMGISLRTCKEKFYGGVHDGLKTWVAAAKADGWPAEDVRAGPPREHSPRKSPVKKKQDEPPQLKLDVGAGANKKADDGWL
ncbi:hypothetical protein OHC33_000228 [Knufia fluminis]|uniref:Formin GTPase-binding domain-containing protein n=1 Tax=Knufia fluminis TaxID=191047 RepID=A0AAN8ICF6_9EURO|nr:hypothetical protein OHC33_000228 [Knufia fluminis]